MSCPVCFGGDDTLMREGLNAGIGVLMGVTAIVLACFARFFVSLARRARHVPLESPITTQQSPPTFRRSRIENPQLEIG